MSADISCARSRHAPQFAFPEGPAKFPAGYRGQFPGHVFCLHSAEASAENNGFRYIKPLTASRDLVIGWILLTVREGPTDSQTHT